MREETSRKGKIGFTRGAGRLVRAAAGRAGPIVAAAAALGLLFTPQTVSAQDSGANGKGKGPEAARIVLIQEFASKLDSVPAQITWDDFRKGIAVQYQSSKESSKKPEDRDKESFVLYTALVDHGEIQKMHTSDAFDVAPGTSRSLPDKFFSDGSMLPSGWVIKGTFQIGKVTIPSDAIVSKDVKAILGDLGSSSPLLYIEPAPADSTARGSIQSAPLIFTFKKGSPKGS